VRARPDKVKARSFAKRRGCYTFNPLASKQCLVITRAAFIQRSRLDLATGTLARRTSENGWLHETMYLDTPNPRKSSVRKGRIVQSGLHLTFAVRIIHTQYVAPAIASHLGVFLTWKFCPVPDINSRHRALVPTVALPVPIANPVPSPLGSKTNPSVR
jgi:hypothetical protein